MFQHVVLFKFKPRSAPAIHRKLRDFARKMQAASRGCISIAYGPNSGERHSAAYNFKGCTHGYSHALVCQFRNGRDHGRYQRLPLHRELGEGIAPHVADVCILDFTTK
ncbi:MAG: Dabb family protein [Alphaproteobacteria bacterium]|nr:Dabb family protein [Alphaproteobacteria bacterium]